MQDWEVSILKIEAGQWGLSFYEQLPQKGQLSFNPQNRGKAVGTVINGKRSGKGNLVSILKIEARQWGRLPNDWAGGKLFSRSFNPQNRGKAVGTWCSETYKYDPITGNLANKGGTAVVAPNPGLNGLAGWWSLNETSGTRADSQGSSHLTPSGTVSSTTGKQGNAASFTSSAAGVLTANDNPQISTGDVDFTIFANFYLTNSSQVTILLNKGQAGYPNIQDYALIQAGTTLIFRVGNGSTNATVTSDSFTTNAWHTVAAWHDSVNNTINIQIDDSKVVKSVPYSGGAMDTTYPLTIGAHVGQTYVFNGRIDEVALYKRVLSADERTWLYNSGNGRSYADLSGNYTYGNSAHKHAVTSVSNTNFYQYDLNGNMTRRVADGRTLALAYDAENRLVKVCEDGSNPAVCDAGEAVVATFTYDGNGQRVKSVMGAETVLFFGPHYEIKNGNQITKYYLAGSSRVAMRTYTIPYNNMTLTYLMGDQLGSTSLAVDASTGAVIETRYKAWGEVRYVTPNVTLPTRNTFTGQYSYVADEATDLGSSGFGLMFYNARWYDPALGRMAQADTVVPDGVQGLDRYAYVNNSPLNYVDPSGHFGKCHDNQNGYQCRMTHKVDITYPTFTGSGWTVDEMAAINAAWLLLIKEFGSEEALLLALGGPLTFEHVAPGSLGSNVVARANATTNTIKVDSQAFQNVGDKKLWYALHETGHIFDKKPGESSKDPKKFNSQKFVDEFEHGCAVKYKGGCSGSNWSPSDQDTTKYGLTNSVEDFADSFASTILYNNGFGSSSMTFKDVGPKRMELINSAIDHAVFEYYLIKFLGSPSLTYP